MSSFRVCHWSGRVLLAIALLASWPLVAIARPAQVRESSPTANAIIHSRHAEYVIRFDAPVDHLASRMQITQGGRLVEALTPREDSAVDVLFASGAAPSPGHYLLHWEAKSADGETSSGDIPFDVAP